MSVPVSVHQPPLDRTQATWLDSPPDLSSTNSTQAHCMDGEHQPTDLAVGVRIPRDAPSGPTGVMARPGHLGLCVPVLAVVAATAMPGSAAWSPRPPPAAQPSGCRGRPGRADGYRTLG